MNTLPIATFNESQPAQQLARELQQQGIAAGVHDESKVERFWFWSEPLAAVHVEVPRADFLKARRLVEEWADTRPVMQAAVRCPECRSSRVEFPQITRKFLMTVVQVALFALHVIPREYFCLDCHFTWPKVKPVEPERDILGWPLNSRFWHPENFPRRDKR